MPVVYRCSIDVHIDCIVPSGVFGVSSNMSDSKALCDRVTSL